MAEIKIEKRSLAWLWVLLGLLLASLLLYLLVFRDEAEKSVTGDDKDYENGQGAIPGEHTDSPVSQYITYINSDRIMTLDHEYTKGALLHLVKAIETTASKVSFNGQADLDRIKGIADAITQDPKATSHADQIGNAATGLSVAMKNMQQAKFPNLQREASEVNEAASSIDGDKLTLDQKDAVKAFFDKAARLLQKMNET